MQPEQVLEIAPERARPLERDIVAPPLRPHYEQRGAGTVFPPQHGGRVELLVVESAGRKGERLVAIVERDGVRVCELTWVRIGPFAPAIKQLVVLLAEGQGRGRVRDDVDPHLAAAQALVLMVAYLGLESLIATSAPPLGADEPALRERWKEAAVRLVLDGVAAH